MAYLRRNRYVIPKSKPSSRKSQTKTMQPQLYLEPIGDIFSIKSPSNLQISFSTLNDNNTQILFTRRVKEQPKQVKRAKQIVVWKGQHNNCEVKAIQVTINLSTLKCFIPIRLINPRLEPLLWNLILSEDRFQFDYAIIRLKFNAKFNSNNSRIANDKQSCSFIKNEKKSMYKQLISRLINKGDSHLNFSIADPNENKIFYRLSQINIHEFYSHYSRMCFSLSRNFDEFISSYSLKNGKSNDSLKNQYISQLNSSKGHTLNFNFSKTSLTDASFSDICQQIIKNHSVSYLSSSITPKNSNSTDSSFGTKSLLKSESVVYDRNMLSSLAMDLSKNNLTFQIGAAFSYLLTNLPTLHTLNINLFQNNHFSSKGIVPFSYALSNIPNLVNLTLSFSSTGLCDAGAQCLGQDLALCKSLNVLKLYLQQNDIKTNGAISLVKDLHKLNYLEQLTLDLEGNEINRFSTSIVGYHIAQCQKLKVLNLDLANNDIQSCGANGLAKQLSQHQSLEEFSLGLSFNKICEKGAFCVSEMIGKCISMKQFKLDLRFNNFDESIIVGLKRIFEQQQQLLVKMREQKEGFLRLIGR